MLNVLGEGGGGVGDAARVLDREQDSIKSREWYESGAQKNRDQKATLPVTSDDQAAEGPLPTEKNLSKTGGKSELFPKGKALVRERIPGWCRSH